MKLENGSNVIDEIILSERIIKKTKGSLVFIFEKGEKYLLIEKNGVIGIKYGTFEIPIPLKESDFEFIDRQNIDFDKEYFCKCCKQQIKKLPSYLDEYYCLKNVHLKGYIEETEIIIKRKTLI